jgi:asparagine synthase (glutamine-hydrolysing)
MCGLFSISSRIAFNQNDIDIANKSIKNLKHRGPDGNGVWIDKNNLYLLGHTRLAIQDLSEIASQPMINNNNTLIFNGEIYNYLELKKNLESKGYSFKGTGDTEVVLASWQEWGEDAFNKFDGMFSIVIYDGITLTVATDAFGEKTIYYSEINNKIYISSELSTLVSELNLKPKINDKYNTLFMINGNIPAPDTFFHNTYKVNPATIIKIRLGKVLSERQYWSLPPLSINNAFPVKKLTKKQLRTVTDSIVESIESRLSSDVGVCLLLSAGIDSSLIAALLKYEIGYDIDCITASFGDSSVYDESTQASELSKYLGLNHEIVNIDISKHTNISNEIIDLYGQPFDNIATLATKDITSAISTNYKVGISGYGGDEVFHGYGKSSYSYKYRYLINSHKSFRKLFSYLKFVNRNSKLSRWIDSFISVKDYEQYIALKLFPNINLLRNLPFFDDISKSTYSQIGKLQEFIYTNELQTVMPNSRNISLDLGSMQSSFEIRSPFLNKKLVSTLNNYDYRSFIAFGQKTVLRDILKTYIPSNLVDRPKRGFVFPKEWVINQNNTTKSDLLHDSFTAFMKGNTHNNNYTRLRVRSLLLNNFIKKYSFK